VTGRLLYSVITPHTPRIAVEATSPPFLAGVIRGSHELGAVIRAARPDLLIVHSTHWVTTFHWYVSCQARHRGHCVADEAPDLIPGLAYDRPGDPGFAEMLVARLNDAEIPAGRNLSPHYHWDYGSYVPLRYIDPDEAIPAVLLSTCIAADLGECQRAGAAVREAVTASGRRAVFIASTALAHQVRRGPELWPPEEHQAQDRRFIELIRGAHVAEAKEFLPAYARSVVAEMSGRTLATMLGTVDETAGRFAGCSYGAYGQSSHTGNISLSLQPIDEAEVSPPVAITRGANR
jgi:3,4-dihydroxyphenylacetate 2,3-dioxygenase